MQPKFFKKIHCFFWLLGGSAIIWVGWRLSFQEFMFSDNSPHMTYRVDVHHASILQRLIHYELDAPVVVRLYRIEPRALLGKSPVVDMSGGTAQVSWHTAPPLDFNMVYVGRDAIFKNIPSECKNQKSLPVCQKDEK
ncbi:hypothetical protein [Paracidovorax cattleyae]|uniref:hypothetical protein n=1 Tax=Paracidovorax cattleyae TaxID=80868 RepID=UPI0018AF952B|nr:hypothetical protein [Paracidovorax cattleyae]MBF9264859.1 hypothetical protein [Paracidovorax cattleyae]